MISAAGGKLVFCAGKSAQMCVSTAAAAGSCSYSMVCSQDNRNNLALSCLQPEFIVHVIVSLFNSHLTVLEIAELLVRWFCRTRHSMKFVGLSSSGSSAPSTFDGAWPKASMSGLYKITKALGNYLRHPLNSRGHV